MVGVGVVDEGSALHLIKKKERKINAGHVVLLPASTKERQLSLGGNTPIHLPAHCYVVDMLICTFNRRVGGRRVEVGSGRVSSLCSLPGVPPATYTST